MVYLCKWDKHLRSVVFFKQVAQHCVTYTDRRSDATIFVDEQHALDVAHTSDIHDFFLLVLEGDHD